MFGIYPIQKVYKKDKNKKDKATNKDWWESCADYFIENTNKGDFDLNILYNARDGIINERDYNYVLNPFNTKIDRYKRFGAKLRDYNIIEPVVNLYLGEYIKRYKNIQVIDTNPNDENKFKKDLSTLQKNYYAQQIINNLNQAGIDTGYESKEQAPLEQQEEEFKLNYDSNRIISGQEALDYITFDQELDDKFISLYEDYLIAGRFISYKGIFNDDILYEKIDPREIRFPANVTGDIFVEDLPYIVREQRLHANEILDRFKDKLPDDCLDYLGGVITSANKYKGNFVNEHVYLKSEYITNDDDLKKANRTFSNEFDLVSLYHVVWRSFRCYKILKYENEIGEILEMEVDEDYKLNKDLGDISLEEKWETCICETWRIEDDWYVDKRELPYDRSSLNGTRTKLPYNGKILLNNNGEPISLVKSGLNYQTLYNIFHYQFEKIMNKNKDKIMVLPEGLIPKGRKGHDEESFMYFTHSNSLAIVDETAPNASLSLNAIKVLDMSLSSYAKEMIDMMNAIKMEWWDKIGMNRQRYGDVLATDGKSNTEQAIYRSSVISENMIRRFEKTEEKDYAGLLDLSKFAWIEGKKAKYFSSDGREMFLELNIDNAIYYAESEFDVFVRNSRIEQEKIEAAKQGAYAIAQKGDNIEVWLETLDMTNFEKTKTYLIEEERKRKALEQQNAQAQQETLKEIEERKAQQSEADNEAKRYVADRNYDAILDSTYVKQSIDVEGKDLDRINKNLLEERRFQHDIKKDSAKLEIDEKELTIKNKLAEAASKNADTNRMKVKEKAKEDKEKNKRITKR